MISRLSTKTLKFIPMGLERGLLFKAEVKKKSLLVRFLLQITTLVPEQFDPAIQQILRYQIRKTKPWPCRGKL